MQVGEGNLYVGDREEHLMNDQNQKGRGIRCSVAMRPERRMRWKGGKWGCDLDRCNNEQK